VARPIRNHAQSRIESIEIGRDLGLRRSFHAAQLERFVDAAELKVRQPLAVLMRVDETGKDPEAPRAGHGRRRILLLEIFVAADFDDVLALDQDSTVRHDAIGTEAVVHRQYEFASNQVGHCFSRRSVPVLVTIF
jgi:hypothetical protein